MAYNKCKIVLLFIMIGSSQLKAQGIGDWFNQKASQKKTLLESILALKAYGQVLQKGYDISKDGLGLIGDIKTGDLSLHGDHFSSLTNVNGNIRRYGRATDIVQLQQRILSLVNIAKAQLGQQHYSATERDYFNRVYDRLLTDCAAVVDELTDITTDNRLQMTDDERIKRIGQLFDRSQSQYGFISSWIQQTNRLETQRNQELQNIKKLRTWNGLSEN